MKILRRFFRITHINYVLIKNGLDEVVLSIPIFTPLRFLSYFNPWYWFANKNTLRGERIRLALETLGPIFVKFGQTLSTRGDLLPDDIIFELSKLQDQVPPFPSDVAIAIIEAEFKAPIKQLFAEFSAEPLASASIAQVHTAKLADGKEVIVKVVRPNIHKIIASDIELLYAMARLLEKYWSPGKRLRLIEIVNEFERTIFDELDLLREAANAAQLRRNFAYSTMLYVPEVIWPLAQTNVLVMERIYGIPVSNIDALKQHNIDLKKLAESGVEIFFTQVFRDCFFHADMHPGNIFVNPNKPQEPQYIAVDFGIIGTLSPEDQRYLAENFVAFFRRDYRRVAVLHLESGWIPANTRVTEFEAAIRTVCEPIFERPLKDISFAQLLMRLFQTGRRFNMEVQPQLMLLQKTLLHIEGLGRVLYPDLDLWLTAKPLLEKWLKKQLGPKAFFKNLQEQMPYYASQLPELPKLVIDALTAIKNNSLNTNAIVPVTVVKSKSRFFFGLGTAFLISAIIQAFALPAKDLLWLTLGLGFVGLIALILGLLTRTPA